MGWHNSCPDGQRLLDRYVMALTNEDAVVKAVRTGSATAREARDARDSLIAARNAYWRHLQHHQCRSGGPVSEAIPRRRKNMMSRRMTVHKPIKRPIVVPS